MGPAPRPPAAVRAPWELSTPPRTRRPAPEWRQTSRRARSLRHDLQTVDGRPPGLVRRRTRNRGQREAVRIDAELHVVAGRVDCLCERPVEVRVARVRQIDGRRRDAGAADPIATGPRAGVVAVRVYVDVIGPGLQPG